MNEKRVTVKDIASRLDLSLGTISKALAGKDGVKEDTRELILSTAESMGYKVNRLAQSLARNPIVIGVLVPSVWPHHYGLFEDGIKEALAVLRDYNINGSFRYVSGLYASKEIGTQIEKFIEEKVDAVIMCPSFDYEYKKQLDNLKTANIPVVLLGTDIDDAERLSCVSIKAKLSGCIAGDMMRLMLREEKKAVALIGNKDMSEHRQKAAGFCESFESGIAMVYETQDEPQIAFHIVNKIIRDFPDVGGIFVATANSLAVCECLESQNMTGKIKVIATDFFPELKGYIENNCIQGVIFQDQKQQAAKAVYALFDYLTENVSCEPNIYVEPRLLLRSNLMDLL